MGAEKLAVLYAVYSNNVLVGIKINGKYSPLDDIETTKLKLLIGDDAPEGMKFIIIGESDNDYQGFNEKNVDKVPRSLPKKFIDANYLETDETGRKVIDLRGYSMEELQTALNLVK